MSRRALAERAIVEISSRVMVMRDGEQVATRSIEAITKHEMIELMVGRSVEQEFPKHHHPIGEPRLRVENLHRGAKVRGVSFEVRAGEVLGITGLVGAGRTEMARLIAGADPMDEGRIYLDGKRVAESTPFKPGAYNLTTKQPLKIGFGQHDYFNGKMRDVRLYNRALTTVNVAKVMGER